MAERHGSATIKGWMQDLVALARSDLEFDISAGAEPDRSYAYLEYHLPGGDHSILLFRVEDGGDPSMEGDGVAPQVIAYRFHGDAKEVREKVDALTHDRG